MDALRFARFSTTRFQLRPTVRRVNLTCCNVSLQPRQQDSRNPFTIAFMRSYANSVLRVGIDDAPPEPLQIGRPETGDFRGYEADLLQGLSEAWGWAIQYRRALWSVIVGELSGGNLDLVCSAATVTAERAQEVDFCTPHLRLSLALVTREKRGANFDFSASRMGVRRGTTAEAYLLHETGGTPVALLSESNDELYSALSVGAVDGVIDDSPIALHFSRAVPGLEYVCSFEGTEGAYAVMIQRGNTPLREMINTGIAQLEAAGTLSMSRKTWFGSENLFIASIGSFHQTPDLVTCHKPFVRRRSGLRRRCRN
jgi:ABC-type amino acid transport substrate-binding protein